MIIALNSGMFSMSSDRRPGLRPLELEFNLLRALSLTLMLVISICGVGIFFVISGFSSYKSYAWKSPTPKTIHHANLYSLSLSSSLSLISVSRYPTALILPADSNEYSHA